MKLAEIKLNPNNPRVIRDKEFEKLKQSIKEFPKMLELRPLVVNSDMVVLGGNQRLKALQELSYIDIPDSWVAKADNLTEEEIRRFIIADNTPFGSWDFELLQEDWDLDELEKFGLEFTIPDPADMAEQEGEQESSSEQEEEEQSQQEGVKLQDKFLIPPFTILDTRQGYWQERKAAWKELLGDQADSREGTLGDSALIKSISNGASVLDPVLSEIANLWFLPEQGKTLDPFAGDSVFGYVSSYLGNQFTGIELREEQARINQERTSHLPATYYNDDGQQLLQYVEQESQDLVFSCPPYFDLEQYSELEQDASNQASYSEFLELLDKAFGDSIKALKPERFAFIVIGDVRDKKGAYRRLPDHVKEIFTRHGLSLYNEMVLVEAMGNLPMRSARWMKTRKIAKCHQNVLVFYKGDPSNISETFPELDMRAYGGENEE
mgnify:CR=1 FL=1